MKDGERLQLARIRAGYTQAQLSKITGVSLKMLQHYEQGHRDFNGAAVVTALKIADALGVDVRDLLNDR